MTGHQPDDVPGLTAVGPVVVLTGPAARAAADLARIAMRVRKLNGYPPSRYLSAVTAALFNAALMSDTGHTDVRCGGDADSGDVPELLPTMPVNAAAHTLGLSARQTRRLARNLGGLKVGGRWLLDAQAVAEHVEGTMN